MAVSDSRSFSQKRRSGFRDLARNIIPFGIRRRVLNILRGEQDLELPLVATTFEKPVGYDVVWFPIIDWNYLFQRPQQLASQFARADHRVFYVHTTFHQSRDYVFVRRPASRISILRLPGPRELNALYRDRLSSATIDRCLNALDAVRSRAEMRPAVSIIQSPAWAELAFAARERFGWKIIYDCIDEHSGFSETASPFASLEDRLISDADLVVATSKLLFDKVSKASPRALRLPNAADFEHFNPVPPTNPLSHIGRPVIGYHGAISAWFDVEMVAAAAAARPEWRFALVGDSFNVDLSRLKLPNIHVTGRKAYAQLPAFLHAFDVAMIPFKLTPLTLATDPVKFYEYLSAGKPVVAVPLPDLEPHRQLFYAVESRDDFVRQIEAALSESPGGAGPRIELARQNTWTDRYRRLDEVILKQLIGE